MTWRLRLKWNILAFYIVLRASLDKEVLGLQFQRLKTAIQGMYLRKAIAFGKAHNLLVQAHIDKLKAERMKIWNETPPSTTKSGT